MLNCSSRPGFSFVGLVRLCRQFQVGVPGDRRHLVITPLLDVYFLTDLPVHLLHPGHLLLLLLLQPLQLRDLLVLLLAAAAIVGLLGSGDQFVSALNACILNAAPCVLDGANLASRVALLLDY